MAKSFDTFIAALSSTGSRKVAFHMPREGKTSSAQMPSSSLSLRRMSTLEWPGGRPEASKNSARFGLGSLRRISRPSTVTVSYWPSGSLTERGIRSAMAGGRLDRHRSSGSTQCESAEFAQIFFCPAMTAPFGFEN